MYIVLVTSDVIIDNYYVLYTRALRGMQRREEAYWCQSYFAT